MVTEKSLRYKILQRAKKIKGLREELEVTIAQKRKDEVLLRELQWKAKEKKRGPWLEKGERQGIWPISSKKKA